MVWKSRAANFFTPRPHCVSAPEKEKRLMDSVAADTIAIIAERLSIEKRNLQLTDRLDDLGINSLSVIEIIFDLEEKFDVSIPYNSNDLTPEFQTVGDIVDALKRLMGGNHR
jgi:acyl carrier protein